MVKSASLVCVGFKLGAATDRPPQPFFFAPGRVVAPGCPPMVVWGASATELARMEHHRRRAEYSPVEL